VALLFARSEKGERSWVGDTLCGVRETVSGWVATILPLPAQVARGGRGARTADFRVRHRNTR